MAGSIKSANGSLPKRSLRLAQAATAPGAKRKDKGASAREWAALKQQPLWLLALGLVDEIIPEPLGGAHQDPQTAAETLKLYLLRHLHEVAAWGVEERLQRRYAKYRTMGPVAEPHPPGAPQVPTPVSA